uniref:Glycosyltransferase n=1 Tax=Thermodesulfobacterium geofontis TaxID=1295609 RepID=A0A7V6CEA8_9BACT
MKVDLYKIVSYLSNHLPYKFKKSSIKKIRPNLKRGAKIGIYGHVDNIDQIGISGWFVDLSSETPPELTILINGIPVGKISIFFYRQDIAQLLERYYLSGFRVSWAELNIPEMLFDEQFWNVEVFYEKANKPLAGGKKIRTEIIEIVKKSCNKITYDLKIPQIDGLKGHIEYVELHDFKILKISGWIFHEKERIKSIKLLVDSPKLSIPVLYGLERLDVFEFQKIEHSIKSGFEVDLPLLREGLFLLKLELELSNEQKIIIDIGSLKFKSLYQSKWLNNINYPLINKIEEILPIFKDFQEDFSNKTLPEPVDIIIPVFNGYGYVTKLFDSIFKNTNPPYRLIVIDDASTDYRVVNFLKRLQEILKQSRHPEFILVRNDRNLGFVASVNKGFSLSQNHVVIMNTDTIVPPGWLYRLMKPIFDNPEEIASTTPFTNAGTICSFPEFLVDNELPKDFDPMEIDNIFARVDAESFIIELPTAVGFCMGINKYALQEVGYFNENLFGKGYGEENDWSMRAKIRGFKNILVPNLFVYHKHGGSFTSEEKQKLAQENLEKIKKLHPEYLNLVKDFINEDPPKAIRDLVFLRYTSHKVETTLLIDHNLGGGANLYSKNLIKEKMKEDKCILHYIEGTSGIWGKIITYYKDFKKEFYLENPEHLKTLLKDARLTEIILNNMVSYRNPIKVLEIILSLKDTNSDISLIIPIHDFYSVCPSYNLLNDKGVYCGVPDDIEVCKKCLRNNIYADKVEEISVWRSTWRNIFKSSDAIICFSNSSKEIIKKAYPEIEDEKFYILPHKLYIYLRKPKLNKPDKELNVAIIGNINYPKGAKIINDLLKVIEKKKLKINLVVVGTLVRAFLEKDFGNLKILGQYERKDLPDILEKENINLVLFPSIWPETFSYVVEECMEMELPIIAFDIGAPSERLRKYEKAKLVKVGDVEGIIKEILKFMQKT